STCR
ncbi:hypothetical protein D046_1890B, partial [Vibrio parahaemolyticus V-223/04]